MKINPYIADILGQPDSLRDGVNEYDPQRLVSLKKSLDSGQFDRIVITGMGASHFGTYPAWLHLVQNGLPAWWVETSELLHYALPLIGERTLLWVVSQSGLSAEIQAILNRLEAHPHAVILATTNDLNSPLAQRADVTLNLSAGPEFTVSTRTYLNTLAVTQLAALQLTGQAVESARQQLLQAAGGIQSYLEHWQEHVQHWVHLLGVPERLIILGRGASLANAQLAALILKESAKYESEGLSAAQFRHGPLELADPRLSTIIIEGDQAAREKNLALARDLDKYQTRVVWLGKEPVEGLNSLVLPSAQGIGTVLAEIVPFQMLTLSLASQTGFEPGIFRHSGKVTLTE